MSILTHTTSILKDLLDGKELVSSDIKASNSNQYFVYIKNQGIELIEVYKPNKNNRAKSKHRRLKQSVENINRAKALFFRLNKQ